MKIKFPFFKVLLFSFVFVFLSLIAQSQIKKQPVAKKQITGQVKDVKGAAMAGASVKVKGSTSAAVTDEEGKFKLNNVPADAKIIVVSYSGMRTQEVNIKSRDVIEIRLDEELTNLNDVVVVGYGTQKKASVVGAISNVKGEDLVRSGVPSVASSLTGLVPGMITIQQSGLPGASDPIIYIRGLSSFAGNNQPLVLVDGIERGLNDIDPNDVESVSVLKDASATAIYGVKGGNGVILVTTKRGQEGRMQIAATYDQTIKAVTSHSVQDNSYITLLDRDMMYRNQNQYAKVLGSTILQHYLTQDMPYIYPNVDAWNFMVKPFATDERAAVSARGGTQNAKYFVSLGYLHQGDLIKSVQTLYDPSFRYDRFNFRMNFDFDLTKSTKFSVSTGGYVGIQNQAGFDGQGDQASIMNNIFSVAPYATPYIYPASILAQYPDPNNPTATGDRYGLNLLNNNVTGFNRQNFKGTSRNTTDMIGTDISLSQRLDAITKGLSFRGVFSYNNTSTYSGGGYTYTDAAYTLALVNNVPTWTRYIGAGVDNYTIVTPPYQTSTTLSSAAYNYVYSGQLDYKRSFKKNNVSALALAQRRISQSGAGYRHFEENWVGRATYDYDGKYLLEGSVAYSGSEQFAPSNRFGLFPSIAAGWNIAKEKFVKELIPSMNNLKVRYSYGETGNDNTGSQWLYISQYTNWNGFTTGAPGTSAAVQTLREGAYPNLNAQWERAAKQDLGFEAGFLNSKITLGLDLYTEQRTGILMTRRAVADWFGQSLLPLNIGSTERHGYEFEFGFNGNIKNIHYWVKGNYNFNENRVLNQDDPGSTPEYQKRAGKPISFNSANINIGYYQNADEIANYSLRQSTLITPGSDKLLDFSGDATNNNDGVPVGNTSRPNRTFMFSAGFNYKNFDFSFMIQGATSIDRNLGGNTNPMWINDPGDMYVKMSGENNVWTPNNTNATYAAWGAWNPGTKAIINGQYARLKTLELGYNFSGKIIKAAGLSSARLALQGSNLFTWAPGYTLGDPENENLVGNSNFSYYPIPKTLTLALKVNF